MTRPQVTTNGAPIRFYDALIDVSASATTSEAIDLQGGTLVGLRMDSGFDGTSVTFTSSDTIDGTYATEQADDGTDFTVTIAASEKCHIQPAKTSGFSNFVKVVSSASEGADTTVRLYVKSVS